MALADLINAPVSTVFRRAYIKRKSSVTGLYESTWQSITPYVIRWGNIRTGIDDVRLNRFTLSGISLQVDNKLGKFNDENNANSLWSGYLTRYGTLLKIEAGYQTMPGGDGWGMPWGDSWGGGATEYPTTTTQGIFIMDQEVPITPDNKITLNASSLKSIFDGVKANEIAGLGATQTASNLLAKIRDHTAGGSYIFRQYISAASWDIQATTNNFNIAASTSLDNEGTAWDFMTKLAEAEGYVLYINRLGVLVFSDRTPNTSASQFSFYGQGFARPNIIRVDSYRESFNKLYNNIRLKHLSPDTTTSYVVAGTTTSITPANVQWKYGARIYEFENTWANNTAAAQAIVNNMFTEFSSVKNEAILKTKFHPEIDPLDRVDVSHYSYNLANKTLWDGFDWGGEKWAEEGENFDWDEKAFKVLSKSINLDDFSEQFHLREV